jgi:hypothetical protein
LCVWVEENIEEALKTGFQLGRELVDSDQVQIVIIEFQAGVKFVA